MLRRRSQILTRGFNRLCSPGERSETRGPSTHWANPAEIKRQFGSAVDFVGDNRVIFDLGGNKYRLVVHMSFSFGRLLVKFIGTHAEYDRIDPETVSWRKK
jgi:mRNA interferase HigB